MTSLLYAQAHPGHLQGGAPSRPAGPLPRRKAALRLQTLRIHTQGSPTVGFSPKKTCQPNNHRKYIPMTAIHPRDTRAGTVTLKNPARHPAPCTHAASPAAAVPQGHSRWHGRGRRKQRGRPSHLPLAAHRPAEHEGGLPAVLQDPQPPGLLEGGVPHSVLESQLLLVDQLPPGDIQLEEADHGQPSQGERGRSRQRPRGRSAPGQPRQHLSGNLGTP